MNKRMKTCVARIFKRSEICFETINAPVIGNSGYPRAWRVPGTAGLKYRDFVLKLRFPSSV